VILGDSDEAMDLLDCFISFLFSGEPEAQIVLALDFNGQGMVAHPSTVMWLHSLDARQWDAITDVPASNGFRPETNDLCVYGNMAAITHNGAMEVGFLD
jgi:hypothetical protein